MIDLIQVHNMGDPPTQLGILREYKQQGRIRYLGDHDDLRERSTRTCCSVMRTEPLDFIGIDYAVDNREVEETILPTARDRGIAVLGYAPFGRTRLWARVGDRPVPEYAKEFGADDLGAVLPQVRDRPPGDHGGDPRHQPGPPNMADNIGGDDGRRCRTRRCAAAWSPRWTRCRRRSGPGPPLGGPSPPPPPPPPSPPKKPRGSWHQDCDNWKALHQGPLAPAEITPRGTSRTMATAPQRLRRFIQRGARIWHPVGSGGSPLQPVPLTPSPGAPGAWAKALVDLLPRLSNRDLLVSLAFLGIAGGAIETAVASIGYRRFGRIGDGWVVGEMLWVTPIATALTLVALGMVFISLRRLLRADPFWNGTALFLLSALTTHSVAQTARIGLHPAAQWLLAVGLATVIVGAARREPTVFRRSTRLGASTGTVLLFGWALLGMTGDPAMTAGAERPAVAVTASRPYNVILLVWDTARARSLSLHGYGRQTTPNLDRFAERAVVFDAAITTAPWTLPAHASLFTGLYPHQHLADRGSPLSQGPRTLAEAMTAQGYRTAGFVANRFWAGRRTGLDRGFERYQDRGLAPRVAMPYLWALSKPMIEQINRFLAPGDNPDRASARMIHAGFLDWADQQDDRPFFAFLNLFDVHDPYLPPESFGFHFATGTPRTSWDTPEQEAFTPEDVQQLRDAYDSSIYYLDYQFGVLLAQLELRGLLENTVIIVTADHGETIGEHRPDLFGHASNIYADVLRVPLVVYAPPGVLVEGRRAEPVSLVDVPATILDLIGARQPEPFAGASLLPVLMSASGAQGGGLSSMKLSQLNPPAKYETFPGWPESRGTLYSLLGKRWHYMVDADGREQLFDLRSDPLEAKDLSRTQAVAELMVRLRRELRRQLR